jgi:hypothetical protein
MRSRKWFTSVVVLVLALVVTATSLHAQPQGGRNRPGGGIPNLGNMTPEQMQQWIDQMMLQMRVQAVRVTLSGAKFTDPGLQEAVVTFVNNWEKASAPLRENNRQFAQALSAGTITEEEAKTSLVNLRAAVAKEKERHEKALQELDTQINYSQQPLLEAVLTSLGIIGDEAWVMGGMGMSGISLGNIGRGGAGQPGG